MNTHFINSWEAESVEEAQALCPQAVAIEEVEEGFICFESKYDHKTWLAQQ